MAVSVRLVSKAASEVAGLSFMVDGQCPYHLSVLS
jgi:hypothetical protein